jgi:hypothetical protein
MMEQEERGFPNPRPGLRIGSMYTKQTQGTGHNKFTKSKIHSIVL